MDSGVEITTILRYLWLVVNYVSYAKSDRSPITYGEKHPR